MLNLKLKIPHFGKFSSKIEILSTHNLVYQKFAVSCVLEFCLKFAVFVWKLYFLALPTLLTHHEFANMVTLWER